MSGSDWDPAQYERFRQERAQPFFDLVALVERRPELRVLDLGCGTGEWTRHLHDELGAAHTLGVDRSEGMLERSAEFATDGLEFQVGDIAELEGDGAWDLVFTNAALHWLPDHPALLERLTRLLAPGGQLAVQVPANFDQPTHVTAAEVAAEEPFASSFREPVRAPAIRAPEEYATWLHGLGYAEQHVRLQVYGHLLPDRGAVVEWVKGTLLNAYRKGLSEELFERFLEAYRDRLLPRLADTRPFFFPFKRLLFHAKRP